MAGGVNLAPPSNPSSLIQREIPSGSPSIPNFITGLEEFPKLPGSSSPSGSVGFSHPASADNQSYVSCLKNLARSSTSTKLVFDGPKNLDGEPIAFFSSGELQTHIELNESLVVGYFVGNRLDFPFVKERLTKLWKTKGDFSMTIYGEKAFLFNFSLEEDRIRILELGSLFIGSRLFLIRPWSPFIEQQIDSIKSVPVWMLIRGLPIHLWNSMGFARISSLVGTPIMTDTPTAMKTRMSYARVCVEIDSSCTFPTELPYQIDDKKYKVRVEFPWKPTLCSLCKSFGHSSAKCGSDPAPKNKKKRVVNDNVAPTVTVEAVGNDSREAAEVISESALVTQEQDITPKGSISEDRAEEVVEMVDLDGQQEGGHHVAASISLPDPTTREILNAGGQHEGVIEEAAQPSTKNWTTFTRKKKKSSSKGTSQAQSCSLNSFSILDTDAGIVDAELDVSLTESREEGIGIQEGNKETNDDKVTVESSDDVSEESKSETDNEGVKVEKMRALEEIPRRKPMTKEQKVNNLVKVSALLGAGGKESDMKNIFSGIIERQSKLNTDKELAKINWPGVTNNDMLGRGKRTPARKK